MPQAPSESLLTHYVLENPWPAWIVLAAFAAFLGWTGFREGLAQRQKASGILALMAVGVLALGSFVTTAGEHARVVTQDLVKATVAKDLIATDGLLADHAVVTFGKPTNPGFDRDFIMGRLDAFSQRFTIDDHSVTSIRAYTESSTRGTVHLSCLTTLQDFPYPSPSRWVVRVEKQADGAWKITHVTCVAVNGETPSSEF